MRIDSNKYTVAELLEMLDRRDLTINREYQRHSGPWPSGARSYFIDTVIEGYPFPKLYMYEFIRAGRIKKELIDGQQRLFAIRDFVDGEFGLSTATQHPGLRYASMGDDVQERFMAYPIPVGVVRNARQNEIIQMFRRMNAYTPPFNSAERRHSTFNGCFKWFINELSAELNEFFLEYNVFTKRQMLRMADAEFLSDCILAMERGITSTSPGNLRSIYKKYDDQFNSAGNYGKQIKFAVKYITAHFFNLRKSHMMKPYALLSLLTAIIHARYEIPALSKQVGIFRTGNVSPDPKQASELLLALAEAHEINEDSNEYAQYTWGCSVATNGAGRRLARILGVLQALGYGNPRVIDNDLAKLLPTRTRSTPSDARKRTPETI